MSTHLVPAGAWRCERCGLSAARTRSEPTCHPDDGAAFVASLTGVRDSGAYDPFFAVTMAETYTPLQADVEE